MHAPSLHELNDGGIAALAELADAGVLSLADTVANLDFDAFSATETIDLSLLTGIADSTDVQTNHVCETGGDSIITDGSGTIRLVGVLHAELDASDFGF